MSPKNKGSTQPRADEKTMRRPNQDSSQLFEFLTREWLLVASLVGLVVTSWWLRRVPHLSRSEGEVLVLLWLLFVVIQGLSDSGLLARWSELLEKGRAPAFKLTAAAFVSSMVLTNDVALLILVPMTLSTRLPNKAQVVILQALAANAGSALTPLGNPQNLFLYWYYGIAPLEFIQAMAPFSLLFGTLILLWSVLLPSARTSAIPPQEVQSSPSDVHEFPDDERMQADRAPRSRLTRLAASIPTQLFLLAILVLIVLHVLPLVAGLLVPIHALWVQRKAFKVDYMLLATFLCFFGLAENVSVLIGASLDRAGHVFVMSALSSQVTGNVPAALLFAKSTTQWKALLWGTNVGGFGSLVASFANLIAYRLYVASLSNRKEARTFTLTFVIVGAIMFLLGIGLYRLTAGGW